MHLHRIDLRVEAKVLGGMALGLGSAMAFGAIMGAAVVSVRRNSAMEKRNVALCWEYFK